VVIPGNPVGGQILLDKAFGNKLPCELVVGKIQDKSIHQRPVKGMVHPSKPVVGMVFLDKAYEGMVLSGNLVWDMGLLCKILD